ncbi:MAG TPA: serine/threonine-protein kinase [Gemmataceae bacterium]|jgi:tetratricopeptide (TPR) repeat protein
MSNDPNAANRQAKLNEILLRHDEMVAAGLTTPRLEDYLKLHPDLAAELRAYFEDRQELRRRTGPLRALAGMGDGEPLPIGSFGKYEVLRLEGVGGMGIVVRAFDVEVKREVVLKVMKEEGLANPDLVRRFRLEGQLLGQLEHPTIVPLHEMGETPDGRKLLYLAMKLVRGHTLDWLLNRRASLDEQREWFLDVLTAVCHAVHFAHGKRVLHRDLKPGNVMVGEHQEIQLTDFGLAKVMAFQASPSPAIPFPRAASAGEQTTIGAAPGSPAYMAPEQARGQGDVLDERCDVFGLGGILCEILTGKPPRTLIDIELLLQDRTDPNAASLAGAYGRLKRCGGPAVLVALCRQCLSFDPVQRPISARAVADAILAYRAGLARAAEDEKLKGAQAMVRAEAAVKRQKLAYGLLVAVVLLMFVLTGLAVVGGVAWSMHERRKTETARLESAITQRLDAWKEQRAKAWAAPLEQVEPLLKEAREQAKAADEQAGHGLASEALRQQAQDALAQTDADLKANVKDRRVTGRLLEIKVFGASNPTPSGSEVVVQKGLIDADRRFAEVFREWGLDPDQTPVEKAAARIRSRPVAVATELIAALDQWAYLRRVHLAPSAGRLFDLANAADHPDPLRQELRQLLASSEGPLGGEPGLDRERVQVLARKVDPRREPTLTLLILALALGEIGDLKTPLSLFEEARQNPDRVNDALLLGQLGQMHGLVGLMELDQRPVAAREGEGQGQAPAGEGNHFQKAVVCAEGLRHIRPKEARFMLAMAYLHTEREKGLKILHELQQERPDDLDLQFLIDALDIRSLFLQGKLPEAMEKFQKVARNWRDDDAGHILRLMVAYNHVKRREFAEAETLCREVCQASKSPQLLAMAYDFIGVVKTVQRMESEALQAFREASRYRQGIPSGYVYVAQKCEQIGKLEEAKTSVTEGLKQEPTNAALLVYAIEFYQRHGQPEQAQALRPLLKEAEFPTDARSLFQLGCGLMRIKEHKLAAKALQQHLKLEPTHTAATTMLRKAEEQERSQQP